MWASEAGIERPRARCAGLRKLRYTRRVSDAFPETRQSILVRIRASDGEIRARAYELLLRGYWRPVYRHVRLRWNRPAAEAEELTQEFFADAFETNLFARYERERAKFRTFVRMCLDRFVMDAEKTRTRKKRGGGIRALSWEADVLAIEAELASEGTPADFDRAFEDEWRRTLLDQSVDALRTECRAQGRERHVRVFELYDLATGDPPSYEEIAAALDLTTAEVTYSLTWARRALRRHVLDRLADVTVDEADLADEMRALGLKA